MKTRIVWVMVSFLMALSLVLASCATTVEEEEEEEEAVVEEEEEEEEEGEPPPTGDWWDKFGEPVYGGRITLRVNELSSLQFDPWGPPVFSGQWHLWQECLFSTDWTLDRSIWAFKTSFNPQQYAVGSLAESWEQPDLQTVIVHLRQGVYYQDKEPVNGRELTADDVVYHYDRLCGTGSGFTMASPFWSYFTELVEKFTATDKYTVTIKFKKPGAINLIRLMDTFQYNYIEAPEVSQQYGDLTDWKNAVGTGPWILTDYVGGSSLSYVKNPNYWGYDERHPQNRLPYADTLSVLCIPDNSTALAALRTGKIDVVSGVNWKQAQNMAKTNPELLQTELPAPGCDVLFNLNKSPFTDINVRKALQLAIDRETIAKVHYAGIVEGTPCGQINPIYKGYAYSYDQWPQQLKDEYSYNPDRAKQILAEAGYPNGFKTSIVAYTTSDLALIQIIKSYFMDINVDMEIEAGDMATITNIIMTGRHEQMAWTESECGSTGFPFQSLMSMSSFFINPSTVNDPVYDAMLREFESAPDLTALQQMTAEADKYALEHHWKVRLFPIINYNVWQPYLKGYSGEVVGGMGGNMAYYARWWIDKNAK